MFSKRIFAALLGLTVLAGCEIPNEIKIKIDDGNSNPPTVTLSCSATVLTSPVVSGAAVPVRILVTESPVSYTPYTLQGQSGTFSSSTTVSRTYANSGSANAIVSDQFTVSDSQGRLATCSLNVTVQPATGGSDLACSLQASPANVHVNTGAGDTNNVVNFVATVTGGTPSFSVNLNAGANSTVTQNISQVSTRQFSGAAKYSVAGLSTAMVQVTDADGDVATCAKDITVKETPSVSTTVSPSTSVPASQAITLTATANGFFGTPTFDFTETENGVSIVKNGNVATIRATDSLTHDFYVNVTADSQTATNHDSAYRVVHLQFVTTLPLNCALTPDSATHNVGDIVTYRVSASSNEALSLTQFTTNGTIVGTPTATSIRVQYNFAGTQSVSARAVSTATGVSCNSGNLLQTSVQINGQPSCSVSINANPARYGATLALTATVPSTYAPGAVQITNISAPANAALWVGGLLSPTIAQIGFFNVGSFPVTVTVQDNAGNSAQCSTTEIVNW